MRKSRQGKTRFGQNASCEMGMVPTCRELCTLVNFYEVVALAVRAAGVRHKEVSNEWRGDLRGNNGGDTLCTTLTVDATFA